MEEVVKFVELSNWMSRMDPNGDWGTYEYSKDHLEAMVSATLNWHHDDPCDQVTEHFFSMACLLRHNYSRDLENALTTIYYATLRAARNLYD